MDDVQHGSRAPARFPDDAAVVPVNGPDYEAARRVAELRGETVDDVVRRALKAYARGRRRSR
jgi:hypothetical protein